MRCLVFLVSALPLSLIVAVCRARGQSDDRPVVGKVGGDVRLDVGATEVDSDAHIVWSYGPKDEVIMSCDDGTCETKLSEKFQLHANGSLTIRSLTANDSGLYKGQIFSKKVSSQNFNLTVVGPSSYSATPTQTSADHSTADPKPTTPPNNWILRVVISCVLSGFAVLLGCAVWKYRGRIKAECEQRFRVLYAPCDREDPGRSSRQENATAAVQDTAVQDTAV